MNEAGTGSAIRAETTHGMMIVNGVVVTGIQTGHLREDPGVVDGTPVQPELKMEEEDQENQEDGIRLRDEVATMTLTPNGVEVVAEAQVRSEKEAILNSLNFLIHQGAIITSLPGPPPQRDNFLLMIL